MKKTELDKVYQDVPSGALAAAVAAAPALNPGPAAAVQGEKNVEPIQPVQPIKPEVPQPQTPVPNVPAPEIEQPRPDIPEIQPNRIEQPVPEIQPVGPDTPEIQPPNTQPGTFGAARSQKEAVPAGASFFDDLD